jgi:hypothetical protein
MTESLDQLLDRANDYRDAVSIWAGRGLGTVEADLIAARFAPLSGAQVREAHAKWVYGSDHVREDFASFQDYLRHVLRRKYAEAERRALQRAIETNPFTIPQAIATAEAFGIAIDALPVGKDIRTRLKSHLDAHIATLQALVDGSAHR